MHVYTSEHSSLSKRSIEVEVEIAVKSSIQCIALARVTLQFLAEVLNAPTPNRYVL